MNEQAWPYEGPRTPRPDELAAVAALQESVFDAPGRRPVPSGVTWPMSGTADRCRDVLGMFCDGQPVSIITRLERDVLVAGQRTRMGFIGGVCTHPDHRQLGLAATVLDATYQTFHAHGVDLVYISGSRGLYLRTGARPCGPGESFTVPLGGSSSVTLRTAGEPDATLLSALNTRSATRFVRGLVDYQTVLHYGYCAGRQVSFRIVERAGVALTYLLVHEQQDQEGRRNWLVLEYAGAPLAAREGLTALTAELSDGDTLTAWTPWHDPLGELLRADGPAGVQHSRGTLKILDFPRLIDRLRGYIAERLSHDLADRLQAAAADRYTLWTDHGLLEVADETSLLHLLLGTPPDAEPPTYRVAGELTELVDRCLPLPVANWTLNSI